MATTTTSIEKVVRKVLDQQFDERNKATIEAIESLSRMLTDEVIPRLTDDPDPDDDAGESSRSNGRAGALRAGYPRPGGDDLAEDDEGIPDDDGDPVAGAVPPAVGEAFEALYATLTGEQAAALEALFDAIASEPADDTDEVGEPDESEVPESPEPERPRRSPHKPAQRKGRVAS